MGTRCTIQFRQDGKSITIYQSMDGNPEFTIPYLQKFLKWNGTRCEDVEYTSANFVFYAKFLAMVDHIKYWKKEEPSEPQSLEEYFESAKDGMGATHTGYGIVDNQRQNEQYFYVVDLSAMYIKVDDTMVGFAEKYLPKATEV